MGLRSLLGLASARDLKEARKELIEVRESVREATVNQQLVLDFIKASRTSTIQLQDNVQAQNKRMQELANSMKEKHDNAIVTIRELEGVVTASLIPSTPVPVPPSDIVDNVSPPDTAKLLELLEMTQANTSSIEELGQQAQQVAEIQNAQQAIEQNVQSLSHLAQVQHETAMSIIGNMRSRIKPTRNEPNLLDEKLAQLENGDISDVIKFLLIFVIEIMEAIPELRDKVANVGDIGFLDEVNLPRLLMAMLDIDNNHRQYSIYTDDQLKNKIEELIKLHMPVIPQLDGESF